VIKIATVFSGIGAIEHALQRMKLKHQIVFACDNGDVDILSKKIPIEIDHISNEQKILKKLISKIKCKSKYDKVYVNELKEDLDKVENSFKVFLKEIEETYSKKLEELIINTLDKLLLQDIKVTREKEYLAFCKNIMQFTEVGVKLHIYTIALRLVSDFTKDNDVLLLRSEDRDIVFESRDGIKWENIENELREIYKISEIKNIKTIIKNIKGISEQISMLHERINTFHILKELDYIEVYEKKKEYVDSLYESKKNKNQVKKSYMANYKISEEDFHWNISFLDGNQYRDSVDLFVGGSPCQSFSLVGKQRGLEDTRGTLFYEYARLINECRPKVFIYENVKAILSNDNGKTWEKMKEVFKDLGYQVNYTIGDKPSVLNAKDYGIPQNRERMFVIGFRKDIILEKSFEFPKSTKLEKKMQDFLLDNVSGRYYLPKKGVDFVMNEKNLSKRYTQIDGEVQLCQKKNQQFNWHGDFIFVEENNDMEKTMQDLEKYFLSEKVKKYVLASGTKGFYSKPKVDLEIARPLLTTMHKMHRAGVDNYVTTEGRLRKLTPRECLRLMGFCDSFKIKVSDTSMYQQAGNSIVVDVLIGIMQQIIEAYPNLIKEENISE